MIHREYAAIFVALREGGIKYCQLRDDLDGGQIVGDLDLLVESKKFDVALAVLGDLRYKVRISEAYLPLKTVLVKYTDARFVVIDLHRTVVQNCIEIVDGNEVLAKSRAHGESFLPSIEHFIVILTLHNILAKGEIQEKHVRQIENLYGQANKESVRAALGSDELAETLFPILDNLQYFHSNRESIADIRSTLLRYYLRVDRRVKCRQRRQRLMSLRRRYNLRPRAPLYALTGVDGVGKSTLTESMLRLMNQPGGFSAATMYMGPWGHYKLKLMRGELFVPGWSVSTTEWLSTLFRGPTAAPIGLRTALRIFWKLTQGLPLSHEEKGDYVDLRRRSRIFVTARYLRSVLMSAKSLIFLTFEMYYRYYLTYRHKRRCIRVIADRYIYDLMTGRMHQLIPNYRRMRALMCRLFPRPSQVFLLHNGP